MESSNNSGLPTSNRSRPIEIFSRDMLSLDKWRSIFIYVFIIGYFCYSYVAEPIIPLDASDSTLVNPHIWKEFLKFTWKVFNSEVTLIVGLFLATYELVIVICSRLHPVMMYTGCIMWFIYRISQTNNKIFIIAYGYAICLVIAYGVLHLLQFQENNQYRLFFYQFVWAIMVLMFLNVIVVYDFFKSFGDTFYTNVYQFFVCISVIVTLIFTASTMHLLYTNGLKMYPGTILSFVMLIVWSRISNSTVITFVAYGCTAILAVFAPIYIYNQLEPDPNNKVLEVWKKMLKQPFHRSGHGTMEERLVEENDMV